MPRMDHAGHRKFSKADLKTPDGADVSQTPRDAPGSADVSRPEVVSGNRVNKPSVRSPPL